MVGVAYDKQALIARLQDRVRKLDADKCFACARRADDVGHTVGGCVRKGGKLRRINLARAGRQVLLDVWKDLLGAVVAGRKRRLEAAICALQKDLLRKGQLDHIL
eukprot:6210378-Pleurochrysis_carterae.AAC.7